MWIAVLYNTVERKETGLPSELVAENEIVGTARGVVEALRGEGSGHEVVMLRVNAAMLGRIGRSPFDVVFNLAEGLGDRGGTEHLIPAFLEAAELPYTGADGTAIALCRDKALTKRVLAASGLPTPAWQLFERADEERGLEFPLIVKPAWEDASVGITAESVVRDEAALRRRVAHVLECYRQPALVEQFIDGREINCALLGNGTNLQVLPLSEIAFGRAGDHPRIVTFESKWVAGSEADRAQRPVCPARLPPDAAAEIEAAARAAFEATGCRDYARIDFRLACGPAGAPQPLIIDVNPNPAIDEGSGFARSARAAGIGYGELISRIVAMAAARGRGGPRQARPPALTGRRLRLEPPAPRHLAALARWFSDEDSGRYMDAPGSTCTEEELAEALFVGREDVDFVACDRSSGEPVGYCGLYAIANGRGQITFLVGEASRRNQGLGREMLELLVRAAFEEVALDAIEAAVVAENEPSLRLCRSMGFREIGRRRGSHRLGERRLDEVLLELARPGG